MIMVIFLLSCDAKFPAPWRVVIKKEPGPQLGDTRLLLSDFILPDLNRKEKPCRGILRSSNIRRITQQLRLPAFRYHQFDPYARPRRR